MFGFSKKDKNPLCPVPDERCQWLELAFEWLIGEFSEQHIRCRRVRIPHHSDFPIRYNGDHQSALETVAIVARQMEIDPREIELLFYKEGVDELDSGSALGNKLPNRRVNDDLRRTIAISGGPGNKSGFLQLS